ncbi:FAD-dependent monooxygenase [Mycolicibacterium mageritense]|uniref:FAD-dependent monooxygenase n=1 Tax=Mycolicibacterium mageritense TaxID=53462 RepID=UPI001E3B0E18|nr:FAD-dependent monooxygenase [Mycolicibacterium mageritense]GJJ21049.1 oxygenase [Mycolicibacterium mageritense]
MTDVAIVGAGPTGLALACGLRAAGISVRVLDKAHGPAVTSRALGLQPRGVEVLDRLGALGDLPERGLPVRRVDVNVDGKALASFPVGQPTRLRGPAALLISQAEIEGALRDRLTTLGGSVEWDKPVTGLAAYADGITLIAGDEEVRAGWVVGADGAHSAVRKAVGIGFPGVPIVERFLLADVHADLDRTREGATSWARADKLLAAFPLPGIDLWRLMAPAPPGMPGDASPDDIVGHLGAALAAEAGGAVRSTVWTSTFRIQRRLADSYRRGRVLLAGDAAHIHSPLGGQGMNTGIGDAENLAFKLALVVSGHADERVLDTYEAERRPIAKDVLQTTSGLTQIVVGQNRVARAVRDHIAIPLLNRRLIQRRITEKGSQLEVSYRSGPWGGRRWAPGIQPGDRIPDRTCVTVAGTAARLYDVLGPQWAFIGPQSLAAVAADRLGAVTALSGTRPGLLIRPDGHVAWKGSDPTALRAWLDSALGRVAVPAA